MSVSAPAPRTTPPAASPRLRVLAAPEAPRSPVSFVLICTAALVMGLLALLTLNISLAQGSYELHDLQRDRALLAEQEQSLVQDVELSGAPGELARRATELGMVAAPAATVLRLSDGTVQGVPVPAAAPAPAEDSAEDDAAVEDDAAPAGDAAPEDNPAPEEDAATQDPDAQDPDAQDPDAQDPALVDDTTAGQD